MANLWPFKKSSNITTIRPVLPQVQYGLPPEEDEEESSLTAFGFLVYVFEIALLWLIIKPVMDMVIADMFPSIAGMTNGWITLWRAVPWIITVWLLWKAVKRLLKD